MSSVVPTTSAPATAGPLLGVPAEAKDSKWFMTVEQVQNSPSRREGIPSDQELMLRQKAAYLIQEMGQKLRVSQLCINTAIVYMHRFYMFHSFASFHRNGIAAASLFLAAKVEEQPRKLESVIQVLHGCLNNKYPEPPSVAYQEQAQDLVFNENVLLQTLGFDVAVDHPHTHVVKTCHLVKACKDLAQVSYFLASNSLHLTTMCLQYRPTVVACFCIYLACKWSRWEIPQSTEGKYWFHYVDRTVTMEILEQLTNEFLIIYENSPSRLKKQLSTCKGLSLNAKSPAQPMSRSASSSSQHHPSAEHGNRSSASNASSHQRATVHHHANKPAMHAMDPASIKPHHSQPLPHPKSSGSSSGMSSSRPPSTSSSSRNDRPDHRNAPSEPHFSAPHRTGSGSASSSGHNALPPLTRGNINDHSSSMSIPPTASHPSQIQRSDPSAYPGGSTSSTSSSGKSRHHQPPYQQMQPAPSQQHKQPPPLMDAILHPKQRTSSGSSGIAMAKDPPPKYMDPKMASGSSKKIPPIASHGAGNKYPDKQVVAPPPPTHNNQSHLVSKSSNYHQQQSHQQQLPPNYSQTINHRNAHQQQQQQQQQSSSDYFQMSVQQQPQQHQSSAQHNPYTSNMSSDSSYGVVGRQPPDELLMHGGGGMMMDTTDQVKPPTSIFSPDWADVKPSKVLPPMESPKLPSTDRQRTDTTPKKEKMKRESPMNTAAGGLGGQKSMSSSSLYPVGQPDMGKRGHGNNSSSSAVAVAPTKRDYSAAPQIQSSYDKTMYNKSRQQPILANAEEDPRSIVKRSYSDAGQFDDPMTGEYNHRENKLRKYDLDSHRQPQHSYAGSSSSYSTSQSGQLIKSTSIFNGIETNPDLVSSLLKESLGEGKYSSTIKMEPIPPQQILQTAPTAPIDQLPNHPDMIAKSHFQAPPPPYQQPPPQTAPAINTMESSAAAINAPAAAQDPMPAAHVIDPDTDHKTKSEKKKKKEKSKHKEKDKSRDREERKKHKKDKDRNRDKESRSDETSSGVAHNPLKIKIPKEKLNLSGSSDGSAVAPPTSGFKITIPKDRLLSTDATAPPSGASLKIKISKDVIENYHGGYSSSGGGSGAGGGGGYDGSAAGGGSSGAINSQHHYHSKKRDRERGDRGHTETAMNRGGGGGGNTAGSAKDVFVNP